MKLLLDTHTFLWFISDDPQLSGKARMLIEDDANEVFFSVASAWEIAIKVSLGKMQAPTPLGAFITQQIVNNEFNLLGVTIAHAEPVSTLPLHHRDPFDRLLIAQTMTEQASIVSVDKAFDAYSVARIW